MPQIKEPNFFSHGYGKVPIVGPDRGKVIRDLDQGHGNLSGVIREAGEAVAIGEASINYMLHPEACAGIRTETGMQS